MIYKNFKDKKLPNLGLGCMRLPVSDGKINMSDLQQMVDYAIKKGVNYFDTAWGYHNGESEKAIGKALSKYPRESYFLASKFPGYDLNNINRVEEIFEEQLARCGTEYFDFYMFHNVCELNIDAYLNPKYRIFEYLKKQKEMGKIRHLGFSTHGTIDTVKRFLDSYGDAMEFCQIQLNWLDWKMQNAKAKVELLSDKNIPIWVMEPLRGGKLVNLAPEYETQLNAIGSGATTVEVAFRYLQAFPQVAVILSGMSNMEQLQQNIDIFETEAPLSAAETESLYKVANAMTSKTSLPCTACRYCTTHCPMELDIPNLIDLYNEHVYSEGGFLAPMAVGAMDENKRPSACIGCRACEAVCPQNIKISEMMTDFTQKLKEE